MPNDTGTIGVYLFLVVGRSPNESGSSLLVKLFKLPGPNADPDNHSKSGKEQQCTSQDADSSIVPTEWSKPKRNYRQKQESIPRPFVEFCHVFCVASVTAGQNGRIASEPDKNPYKGKEHTE